MCSGTKKSVFMRGFGHSDRPESLLKYCYETSNKHPVFHGTRGAFILRTYIFVKNLWEIFLRIL